MLALKYCGLRGSFSELFDSLARITSFDVRAPCEPPKNKAPNNGPPQRNTKFPPSWESLMAIPDGRIPMGGSPRGRSPNDHGAMPPGGSGDPLGHGGTLHGGSPTGDPPWGSPRGFPIGDFPHRGVPYRGLGRPCLSAFLSVCLSCPVSQEHRKRLASPERR